RTLRGALRANDDADPDHGGDLRGRKLRYGRNWRGKRAARNSAGRCVPGDDPDGAERELRPDHRTDWHAGRRYFDHSGFAGGALQRSGSSWALKGICDVQAAGRSADARTWQDLLVL